MMGNPFEMASAKSETETMSKDFLDKEKKLPEDGDIKSRLAAAMRLMTKRAMEK